MEGEEPAAVPEVFSVRDCALTSLATGLTAESLKELRDGLLRIPTGSLYQHFWGRLLRPRFDEPEYNNDVASWVYHALHQKALAERLSVIDPARFSDLEALRQEVVELVEQELDDEGTVPWRVADHKFHFVQSQIVVFDTGLQVRQPSELSSALPDLPTGSIFYHFIDARRRRPDGRNDFSAWLCEFGAPYETTAESIDRIDPYFSSLKEIRRLIAAVCQERGRGEGSGEGAP